MSKHSRQRPSLFWPLLLIGAGIVLLLSNLGILPPVSFNILWRFWPLALVVIGLDILLGRRSAAGSIISSIFTLLVFGGLLAFIFFAYNRPDFIANLGASDLQRSTISAPLEDFKTANISIDWTSSPAKLFALSDSNKLLDGHISYYGNLYFDVKPAGDHVDIDLDTRVDGFFITAYDHYSPDDAWEIGLHPGTYLNLTLDASSGPADYDFSKLTLDAFTIDAGSGPLTIKLPEAGRIEGAIDGGSGSITLVLPDSLAAKISLDGDSGSFQFSDRFSRNRSEEDGDNATVWVTDDFSGADNYLILEIESGSGVIRIE